VDREEADLLAVGRPEGERSVVTPSDRLHLTRDQRSQPQLRATAVGRGEDSLCAVRRYDERARLVTDGVEAHAGWRRDVGDEETGRALRGADVEQRDGDRGKRENCRRRPREFLTRFLPNADGRRD